MSAAAATATNKPVIGVIFYSTYNHVAALAEEVIAGVEAAGAICKPYQIEETLSEEVLTKMYAGSSLKPKYPLITPEALKELDGFLLGSPTRYGRLPAQVSAFFDKTGGLWASGALVGKFASTFTSTSSQHGGQETTHLTTMPFFVHHGIIYVPIGYTQPYLSDLAEAHGGTPWGVTTIAAADGSRKPTAGELALAKAQGEYFTKVVAQSVRGRHLIASDAAGTTATTTGLAAKTAPQTRATDVGTDGVDAVKEGYTVDNKGTTGAGAGAGTAAAVGAGAAVAGAAGTAAATHGSTTTPAAGTTAVGTTTGTTGTTGTTAAPGTTTGTAADKSTTPAATTTTTTAADPATAAATTTTPAGAPAAATAEGASTSAAAGSATEPKAKPTPTAPPAQKKKGGLFSCCSGSSIE